MLRSLKQNLVHTRRPTETQSDLSLSECLLQRYVSAVACCRGRGSGCSRPGCGISPLEEIAFNPTIEPPELRQDWGNRLMEGTNRTLHVPGPRRRSSDPTRDWPRLASEYPGVSIGGMDQWWHDHRERIKIITWTTALSNSMKLWAMPCRATQDGWVML